ncbi:MAG: GTP cyclohydrolase I FolE [Holosporaceae bacterium]|jgi:GTP cyclohydrolase I|nr:GTP cyclohydrolase I FolE [Holosporaceae bacterium]
MVDTPLFRGKILASRTADDIIVQKYGINGKHMEIEMNIRAIIGEIDPNNGELAKTPERVAKSYDEFFSGYNADISQIASTFYDSKMDDLVILKNISFESHCEHHLVPIVGVAHVGYVPNRKIIGASKLARIVDCFAHRLQLQERMTIEIGETLETILNARGVGVYIEAEHFCISHRGVKKQGAKLVTRYFSGALKDNLRQEFLATISEK